MLPLRIVLSLCLLTASVSFAQTAPVDAPAEEVAPKGELFPYQYKYETEDSPALVFPRVIAEVFGGVLGGVGMGIVGLLAGVSALEDVSCGSGEVCAATILIITVPAVFVGIPLGVQYAGQGLGGRGDFLPSLAGTLLGTGAGLLYGLSQDGAGYMAVGLIVGPVLGAVIGYELSHAMNASNSYQARAGSSAAQGLRMAPLIGATPRGGFLGGLSGSF